MKDSICIESMTGFGEARLTIGATPFLCRVKSLNHRFLDVKVKLPRGDFFAFDQKIRKQIATIFKRGSIELSIQIDSGPSSANSASKKSSTIFNLETAKATHVELKKLAKKLKLKAPNLEMVLRMPGVLNPTTATSESGTEISLLIDDLGDKLEEQLMEKLVKPALLSLKKQRQQEGTALGKHFSILLKAMRAHLEEIKRLEPIEKEKARQAIVQRGNETLALLKSLQENSQADTELFQQRLREEAVFWIERKDFDEERVRFGMHLDAFEEHLTRVANSTDPLGRKLEFLHQELLRETNTLGTKAQSTAITTHTIELKSLLERLREQLANVE